MSLLIFCPIFQLIKWRYQHRSNAAARSVLVTVNPMIDPFSADSSHGLADDEEGDRSVQRNEHDEAVKQTLRERIMTQSSKLFPSRGLANRGRGGRQGRYEMISSRSNNLGVNPKSFTITGEDDEEDYEFDDVENADEEYEISFTNDSRLDFDRASTTSTNDADALAVTHDDVRI